MYEWLVTHETVILVISEIQIKSQWVNISSQLVWLIEIENTDHSSNWNYYTLVFEIHKMAQFLWKTVEIS